MRFEPENINNLLDAAMDKTACDLAVLNTQYVNLFTGEIYPADVYIHEGYVVFVDKDRANPPSHEPKETLDAEDRYIVPGLIDSHVHIESSMLTPLNFAKATLPLGVTCVIHDPHELTNVFGEEAVRYFNDVAKDLPQRQLSNIPSCVPSVPGLESAGGVIEAEEVRNLAKLENVVGLGEVMDFVGVVNHTDRMMSIIEAAREAGLYIQGHIPVADPRLIAAYVLGGPWTCHESRSPGEALTKLRAGMYVDARDSSMARNVSTIWEDVKDLAYRERLTFCTDDREADDILEIGQLDDVLRHAMELGMEPVEAIRSASLRTAEAAKLENMGAVAPGFVADFLLLDDLKSFQVHQVFAKGKEVARDGKLTHEIPDKSYPIEERNSVNLPSYDLETFTLRAPETLANQDSIEVNLMAFPDETSLYASLETVRLPLKDGVVDISGEADLAYVAVMNRYGTGDITLGLVRKFGLNFGAKASTISHDCHNLCVVFKDPESALTAVKALDECGGGLAAANKDEVLSLFPLPLGGLMSLLPAEETAELAKDMKACLHKMGVPGVNPILRIATLCLIVIPDVKYSDYGLVDVVKQELIPIFPEQDKA
jgi:adenine deaminase